MLDEDELEIDEDTGEVRVRNAQERSDTTAGKRRTTRLQEMAQSWVESPFTELLIIFLLVFDICLTVAESGKHSNPSGTENFLATVTGFTLCVFTFETLVRIFGYRSALINGDRLLDSIDVLLVIVSDIIYLFTLLTNNTSNLGQTLPFARAVRLVRLARLASRARKWVGLNRRRYKNDGFDLDLTYITPSVIAMSLPSTGSEASYRNPIQDVARFFNTYHREQFLVCLCVLESVSA